jgi:hypothetical protein
MIAEGYRYQGNSVNIEYGSAWHIFRERYILSGGDYSQAWKEASNYLINAPIIQERNFKWLDVQHLKGSCDRYKELFGVEVGKSYGQFEIVKHEGKPLIESTFAFEYYKSETLTIILAGTIDEIVILPYGIYGIGDDKTTSKWDYDGYLNTYAASSQLRFYYFCMMWFGKKFPDSLWGQIVSKGQIGCYINGVFLGNVKTTEFKRSKIFSFREDEMEEFGWSLDDLIQKLQRYVNSSKGSSDIFPIREGFFNGSCTFCPFMKSCLAATQEISRVILDNDFVKRNYNPLEFRKQP